MGSACVGGGRVKIEEGLLSRVGHAGHKPLTQQVDDEQNLPTGTHQIHLKV